MFDGVPEQFHQFITPRTSHPLHLPFTLNASNSSPNTTFPPPPPPPPFDPYTSTHHPQLQFLQLQPNNHHLLHHPLHHQSNSTHKDHEEKEENSTTAAVSMNNFQIERDQRQLPDHQQLIDPWTNDEVLSLLRIRSNMESWFPELTWEHVSRKLAEVGYKRSAEKCKEKFEEESRYFDSINNYTKNFRFISEFEDLYQGGDQQNSSTHQIIESTTTEKTTQEVEKLPSEEGQDKIMEDHEDSSRNHVVTKQKEQSEEAKEKKTTKEERKRKRVDDRFEMLKGYCESIVHKMMEQQEDMHKKLLEDMVRRDEEKFAREEAWKKQEVERMNKELEIMAQEQAIAGDRQANMIQFLNNFAQIESGNDKVKVTNGNSNQTSSSPLHLQNPNPSSHEEMNSNIHLHDSSPPPQSNIPPLQPFAKENPSSSTPPQDTLILQVSSNSTLAPIINPISNTSPLPIETNISVSNKTKDHDVGRRWPKDEVLALINLRCTTQNNNNAEDNKEGNKAPLWERISQGMLEMGYKRSAKRCKEKWENINKYFRKTKDVNKKRSLDSRTCPYFHQLSNLYNQGKLVLQSERQENQLSSPPENSGEAVPDQNQGESSQQVGSSGFSMQADHDGEKTLMQVPSLDFDQF